MQGQQYYDYSTNTCSVLHENKCLAYTQVVWAKSTELGCARVVCVGGDIFIVCNYYPPGNILGQRPY
ncbi:pathogenesis-related protein PRB1-3-like [Canna indica]|uniref:Pathogenesis-related protein PRB1-3-like n=1 Tax=Canna indica TaxID=4628 RepID=A0AAQ3KT75_9LILI|nr:pathogenesis-related protein PRB1-3-like [Canna indica]